MSHSALPPDSPLPFRDAKPVGAADFHTAINATFRFIARRFGAEGLRRYWRDIGRSYYAPVTARWRQGGLPAVARYWQAFFSAEPGGEVSVSATADEVMLSVRRCPAIHFLRDAGREILPEFCQHCWFVSQAIGEGAGIEVRVCGGNGACTQTFARAGAFGAPQDLQDITSAA